jgi:hypothetical protein
MIESETTKATPTPDMAARTIGPTPEDARPRSGRADVNDAVVMLPRIYRAWLFSG